MVHKPKHKVHSFRGLLGDGGQDEINLERQNVNVAYRIVKFEAISNAPGNAEASHVLKVYRESQDSIPSSGATIDFTETDLLAAIDFREHTNEGYGVTAMVSVFDNILFSRNIFVTQTDNGSGATSCNYYVEIEEVPVAAATLMQLKLGVARKLNLQQD